MARGPKQHVIRSWSDLAALAERVTGEAWIFRGEHTGDNPLRPGAGRLNEDLTGSRKALVTMQEERAALQRFKNDALPYLTHTPARENDLEWLALAQHHGMQTRLLDWTESLLIAAFFAVENIGAARKGVIYGISGLPVVEATVNPFEVKDVSVYRPSHLTPRIGPQWSVFTVHPNPTEDFRRSGRLTTWTINGSRNCWQIKRVLDSCGINYASIYPDLTGLARHIYWRYKWGMSQTRFQGNGLQTRERHKTSERERRSRRNLTIGRAASHTRARREEE
jgi:hypothetical protein